MAMIDYGAILRVDGEMINRDQFFMDESNTGFVLKTATGADGKEYAIDGNYFVYAGDEHFLIVVYKTLLRVIHDGHILWDSWGCTSIGETRFFDGLPGVKVQHLDASLYPHYADQIDDWERERIIEYYPEKKANRLLYRAAKRRRKPIFWDRTNRYVATWDYDGRHYEVIYGYGVDPQFDVWVDIKDSAYDFTKQEKEIIDLWFSCK